jgi:putative hydrolase of HD superfamily
MLLLAKQLHLLKDLTRTGWKLRGIPAPESVAAHSFGTAMWCLWLAARITDRNPHTEGQPSIDLSKLLSMALLHDLAEAQIGDLVPDQKRVLFGPDPAHQREMIHQAEARFWQLFLTKTDSQHSSTPVPNAAYAATSEANTSGEDLHKWHNELFASWQTLWLEYCAHQSIEARIVKRADALDCVMQAISYRQLYAARLEEFAHLIPQAAGDDAELEAWLRQIWRNP